MKLTIRLFSRPATLVLLPCLLIACGTQAPSNVTPPPPPPPVTFTVGGMVQNLVTQGSGVVLLNNGTDTLTVTANGSFTFSTKIDSGGKFDVTVQSQPSNPTQNCEVVNGSGVANANVTNIQVNCAHGEWSWMDGSQLSSQKGTYGTLGVAATANIPGSRSYGAFNWTDSSGNLWLFGGFGFDSAGTAGDLNDLWKYNVSSGEWTWVNGSNTVGQDGNYGTLGTAALTNIPGARDTGMAWADSSGNLWLFGGYGLDSAGMAGDLNDLWKYNISSGEWTWMGGSNTDGQNQNGIYGTLGTAALTNVPGARDGGITWTDSSGNLWLFGGFGFDSVSTDGENYLNDLWKYNISSGEWTWVNGANIVNQNGKYGTLGTGGVANVPGSRAYARVSWMDSSGNLWLFGGFGLDSAGTSGGSYLNDLWKYTVSAGQWTWMSGSNTAGQRGIYGSLGTASAANVPGARYYSTSWTDLSGNLWLFGGVAVDSAGAFNDINDLWSYNISSGQWAWMGGSNVVNQSGAYGTLGAPAPGNGPGSRDNGVGWIDMSGNLWLFGGETNNGTFSFNDLWMYLP